MTLDSDPLPAAGEPERPPWYRRAFHLFAFEHFDSDNAAMLARSEWQQQQRRLLDGNEPERPIRMVGYDRGQAR